MNVRALYHSLLAVAIALSFSSNSVNGRRSYSRLIEPSPDHCANQGIPCGGHTFASCSEYCVSNGYIYGQCEDSCCFCYQVRNDISTFKSGSLPWYYPQQPSIQLPSKTFKDYSNGDLNPPTAKPPRKQEDVCTTSACINAAAALISNMNANVNPCDNFYEFACGGFLEKVVIPNDQSSVTAFTTGEQQVGEQVRVLMEEPISATDLKPFRMAKTFYKSCMNKANIEYHGLDPLKSLIKRLGGWPVLEGEKWNSKKFHWTTTSLAFRKEGLSQDYFMSFAVSPDTRESTKRVLTFGEAALGIASNILLQGLHNPVVRAYHKFQVDMAVLLGAERSKAETEMMDALKFEQQLASIFIPAEERRSPDIFYNPMTISQLQRKYPAIDWINYIHRLLPTNVKVAPNENVIVHSPKYIEKFLSLISTTPLRTQANYAMWRAAAASVTYMNEEVRKVHSEFSAAILGKVQRQSRQKECIAVVSSVLGNAIGAMYIRRYFQEEAKAAAQEMVDDIGIAFLDLLDEANWMDARTRQKAKEKAWAMHSHIGYPQEHRDDKLLNSFYGKFQINDGSYLRNVLSIARTATDFAFGRLRSQVNKTEWLSHGRNSVVNAFYHPQENSILFPAAILQGHFFDTNRPKYMNYGAIGWVIGHEISHGFDRQGHQYDKNGDFRDWWDPSTKKTYQSRTQCFVQQYGNFVATDVQLRLNGENSEGENVADNGGIKEAYRGYGHWVKRNGPEKGLPGLDYTPNQLFWITAANNWCTKMRPEYLRHTLTTGVHAPGEFRVLGTFANSKEFAKDFNCPLNSRMNPALKCSLW